MKLNSNRKIGNNGPLVFPIGLGAMSFTNFYGPCNDKQASDVLKTALELGINHIDTSNVYGNGVSEERIGSFLAKQGRVAKDFFSIATKASIFRDPISGVRSFNNTFIHLEEELDKSLNRMGLDQVDLFYVHRRDPKIPIEEVTESLSRLVEKGKTKCIGFSEIAPSSLKRASSIHHVSAVQSEYSLSTRSPELGLIETCKKLGTALVAFSPLGRSLLTDKPLSYKSAQALDFTKENPRFMQPNYNNNIELSNVFRNYAADHNIASSSLAIAWILSKGDHIIPIPGTRSSSHLRELAFAIDFQFTSKILEEIENILPLGWVHGDRYSESQWIGPERYC